MSRNCISYKYLSAFRTFMINCLYEILPSENKYLRFGNSLFIRIHDKIVTPFKRLPKMYDELKSNCAALLIIIYVQYSCVTFNIK